MTITNRVKITISPLRLHAASSVRIPTSTHSFRTLLPIVRIRPLNLFSASSVDLHGAYNRQRIYTRLSCESPYFKMVIYTAAVPEPIQLYTRLSCAYMKWLFTRQPFQSQFSYIHDCRVHT